MKLSIWDILTGVMLLGIVCMAAGFGVILVNPNAAINPLRPVAAAQLVPTLAVPVSVPVDDTPSAPVEAPLETGMLPAAVEATPTPLLVTEPQTGDMGGIPTLRPSSTPVPSPTAFRLPTFTSIPPTMPGQAGGRCQLVSQDPGDGSAFAPGSGFTVRWTLRNTSSDPWRSDSVDLRFVTGARLHSGPDSYDLNTSVDKDGTLEVLIAMRAPSETGSYTSNWGLFSGDRALCRFYVQIRSKNPN